MILKYVFKLVRYHCRYALRLPLILIFVSISRLLFAQLSISPSYDAIEKERGPGQFPDFTQSIQLEEKADTTANVSFADFDGDSHLDILLVKGRHWPIVDRILLGDGAGGIRKSYDLGPIADRSYTGIIADFNNDAFPDIAISNDSPDKKLIYLNDGKGHFAVGSEFGIPRWPTRNLSIADINKDNLPDLLLANRGNASSSNYFCLNEGNGKFKNSCIAFAQYPVTTITPVDLNKDGYVDLVAPHRDGGQSYIYLGSREISFSDTNRIPFGPPDAMIRQAALADFNQDDILDIVAIDEKKGGILFVGQANQTFQKAISLSGTKPVPYALAIADLNNDKKTDIIIGHKHAPSTVYFNKGNGADFERVSFGDSQGSVYGFAIGDFNEDGTADIAAARSDAPSILYVARTK
jgi:hypothetical protein